MVLCKGSPEVTISIQCIEFCGVDVKTVCKRIASVNKQNINALLCVLVIKHV